MPSILCIFVWWLSSWDSCSWRSQPCVEKKKLLTNVTSWFLIESRITELKPVSFDLHMRAQEVLVNRMGTCDVSWDSVMTGIWPSEWSNVIPGWHVSWGLFCISWFSRNLYLTQLLQYVPGIICVLSVCSSVFLSVSWCFHTHVQCQRWFGKCIQAALFPQGSWAIRLSIASVLTL